MSGVPSSARFWFAIWGDRRARWRSARGQVLFPLNLTPVGPPPRSHHSMPEGDLERPRTPVGPDAAGDAPRLREAEPT
jgi:hypothetical protein